MVKVSALALRQAAQVQEVQSVEEALEALRKLWKEDEGVRKLLEEAARHGYTLVQTKDVEPAFVAAVRTALAKLRERLGEEKPSTLRVKYDSKRKEERSKPKPKPMTWESPEGVRYTVEVYDLTPREEKYWGFRDARVEDALRWVESFISMAEYEEGASVLEEALEYEDNPHFERDLIPEDLKEDLRVMGWDGTLRSLRTLVESLPAREKEFKERVRSITALVDREEGKVLAVQTPNGWEIREASKDVVNAVLSLGLLMEALEKEDWRAGEVRRYVEDLKPFTPGLMASLNAIATLRRAKYLLDELGRGRRVAVYRDPSTGEPVYRTPVIG
uniref:Uncharacterized protein n=1 Tax=Thermus aquaticus TaxID=271 RepID=A0A2U9QI72_THEAQ|nr:hypothetical protein [Thermus aquaticus]AWU47367.1 hypothetical protein B6246_p0195 [Thermus aquaticus]